MRPEFLAKSSGEEEMSDVVGTELCFKTVHDSSILDQDIDGFRISVHFSSSVSDGSEGSQVDNKGSKIGGWSLFFDLVNGFVK